MKARSIPTCLGKRRKQRGLSLIELMVAMVIGLIIIGAVVQIFSSSRATYQTDEGLARAQENGRFAVDFLTRAVRQAANTGCARTAYPTYNYLKSPSNLVNDWSKLVFGYEWSGSAPGDSLTLSPSASNATSGWNVSPDTTLVKGSTAGGAGALAGSDVLIVRQVATRPFSLTADTISTQVSVEAGAATAISPGDVVVITDCEKASIFQATGVSGTGPVLLAHDSSGNDCADWGVSAGCTALDANSQSYKTIAAPSVFGLQTYAYYIAVGSSGGPALFVANWVGSGGGGMVAQELVDGIENMQVLYGVDRDGGVRSDGDTDQYMTAEDVTTNNLWDYVVSVRVSLLVATSQSTGSATETTDDATTYLLAGADTASAVSITPPPDKLKLRRRVFDTTVQLRNRGT